MKPRWGPNLEEFKRRFDPATTNGEGILTAFLMFFSFHSGLLVYKFCSLSAGSAGWLWRAQDLGRANGQGLNNHWEESAAAL